MRQPPNCSVPSVVSAPNARLVSIVSCAWRLPVMLALLAAVVFNGASLRAQAADQVTQEVSAAQVQVLPHHLPAWASKANNTGAMPARQAMGQMTMVLSRSAEQEAAFDKLLADQQNPKSPDYHRWLTPEQTGERFGLSQHDVDSVTGWLQSQGLHVNWVSPSRTFIGFGGTVEDTGRAFHTELHYYQVNGEQRFSVASDPMIPKALVPVIKAIRGLYTINEKPLSHHGIAQRPSPEVSFNGNNFVGPEDFATIYDLPGNLTGAGVTIGIVGRSRTDFTDFKYFRDHTGSTFANPTEIVPTAFGGVDPGPAYTTQQGSSVDTGDQGEAELDVTRAGSVAPGAKLLLVVASESSGDNGALMDDAQYLVQTSPVPVQVMTLSFGLCESVAGQPNVDMWDALFKQAAGEGISVYVASGDAGASGCDPYNGAPPASPKPNSPNYICSSSYATCVGGTEFNDTGNPSQYWGSNDGNLGSALMYIPEGGWNEPQDQNSNYQASSSGGGVSLFIATPSWQTGTGVPSAKTGRYTPDIAFTSAGHDGYFGCFAASGASCVPDGSGNYSFEYSYGTSAASPDMAGITALLDQQMAGAQGSLNPQLYQLAASSPTAFHDATVDSSGVSPCSVNTPSICNNSIPSPNALTGGQAGFLLTAGFDEVTGLGSLDVSVFITDYAAATSPNPGFTISGTAVAITAGATTGNTSAITVTPTNAFTGTVTFTCAVTTAPAGATSPVTCTPPSSAVVTGTTAVTTTTPLTITSTSTTTGGAYAVTVTGTSGNLVETGVVAVTVTAVNPNATFTMTITAASPATVAPGGTSVANVTVATTNGYGGTVSYTCAESSGPNNAFGDTPICAFTNVAVDMGTTTPFSLETIAPVAGSELRWPSLGGKGRGRGAGLTGAGGGVVLALLLFLGIPARRRSWRAMLGMLVAMAALGSLAACGGGGGGTKTPPNPGTVAGTYVYTVTATGNPAPATQPPTVTFTVVVN